jgi:hypothetical protein
MSDQPWQSASPTPEPSAGSALDPALGLGEMFTEGRLVVEQGSIYDLVSLLKRNGVRRLGVSPAAVLTLFRIARDRIKGAVTPEKARRNVAHHYDLEAGLFDLFLDEDRQYSCAYFETPRTAWRPPSSPRAPHRGQAPVGTRRPRPRHRLRMGRHGALSAQIAGARVTGVTLSQEQLRSRVGGPRRGASPVASDFRLEDYRRVEGRFDRIVSVGSSSMSAAELSRVLRDGRFAAGARPRRYAAALHRAHEAAHSSTSPSSTSTSSRAAISQPSRRCSRRRKAGLLVKDIEILPMPLCLDASGVA